MKTKPSPAAAVAARLARVKETPIAPAWLLAAATGDLTPAAARRLERGRGLEAALEAVQAEAQAVVKLREALDQLPPAWPKNHRDLLL